MKLHITENTNTTKTTEELADEHNFAVIRYMCPVCHYLNEIICQPGPISLRQQCAQCNSWHRYKPTEVKE
jgi:hypothetical protein